MKYMFEKIISDIANTETLLLYQEPEFVNRSSRTTMPKGGKNGRCCANVSRITWRSFT